MSTPRYTATLDPETGKWFFLSDDRRYSGFKFQKTCQGLADSMKRAAQETDTPRAKSNR